MRRMPASQRLLFFLSCLLTLVLAPWVLSLDEAVYPPYTYRPEKLARLARRQHPPTQPLVTEETSSGAPLVRPEIRQLQQNEELWTLFLLGVSWMQYMNQTEPASWYGISGIHAVPFPVWANARPLPGNEHAGYCHHISVLFPTWHRSYLALYEQVLYQTIQMIASLWPEGPDRERHQDAAVSFRIPYWDWATTPQEGDGVLPLSVGQSPSAWVNGPDGWQQIANPLFSYSFKPLDTNAFTYWPFMYYNATLRAPTTNDSSAQSNNSAVAMLLAENQPSVEQRIYNLFATSHNYNHFSNDAWYWDKAKTYDSIESVHDTIHTLSGGLRGHMSYIPYSAFDPVFFLHHAMVDRLVTMWQILYPNSWIQPTAAVMPTATTKIGDIVDSTTALAPFLAWANGSFWTSDMVRDPSVFGYTYSETTGASMEAIRSNPDVARQMQNQVITAINRLYGNSSPSRFVRTSPSHDGTRTADRWHPSMAQGSPGTARDVAASYRQRLLVNNQYREWIANIHVDKQALDQPFVIHFFLGAVSLDPASWANAPNHIGSYGVFATNTMHAARSMSHMVSGTVPLTAGLTSLVGLQILANLETDNVESYLRTNLHIRVVAADGNSIDPTSITSLGISIVSSLVKASTREDRLPIWSAVESHFDVI